MRSRNGEIRYHLWCVRNSELAKVFLAALQTTWGPGPPFVTYQNISNSAWVWLSVGNIVSNKVAISRLKSHHLYREVPVTDDDNNKDVDDDVLTILYFFKVRFLDVFPTVS